MLAWSFACGMLLLSAGASSPRAHPEILAVWPVQTTGLDSFTEKRIRAALRTHFSELPCFQRWERKTVSSRMAWAPWDCGTPACVQQIGRFLSAAWLLATHVGRIENTYVVHMQLWDVGQGIETTGVAQKIQGEGPALHNGLQASLRQLGEGLQKESHASRAPQARVHGHAPSWTPRLVWGGLGGIGIAGIATGVVQGWAARQTYQRFQTTAGSLQADLARRGRRQQAVANGAYAVGILSAVAAVAGWGWTYGHGDVQLSFSQLSFSQLSFRWTGFEKGAGHALRGMQGPLPR